MELRDIPGAEYIPRFDYFLAGLFELFSLILRIKKAAGEAASKQNGANIMPD